ncbi:transmembrane protein 33-like [Oscarella lobularis]|uniref:transmembrane protein 33-like n=1 Tax=Oscarella lobularis TaxID=121494 RepID=UPI00331432A3
MATSSETPEQPPSLKDALSRRKKETALFLLRFACLFCSIAFIVPFIGNNWFYSRALLLYAVVSVVRLSQRAPAFEFSRQYLQQIFLEDSFHYLLYCFAFLGNFPLPFTVLPISLYCLLHTANFLKSIRESLPYTLQTFLVRLSTGLDGASISIFRVIAFTEIILFPIIVVARIGGLGSVFNILLHYQFLTLRYLSRRNPYTKVAFNELRLKFESMAAHPSCPSIVRKAITRGIAFISRLSPAVAYSTPERP